MWVGLRLWLRPRVGLWVGRRVWLWLGLWVCVYVHAPAKAKKKARHSLAKQAAAADEMEEEDGTQGGERRRERTAVDGWCEAEAKRIEEESEWPRMGGVKLKQNG